MSATLAERAVTGAGRYDPRPCGVYGRISKRRGGDGGGAYVKIEGQKSDSIAYVHDRISPDADVIEYDDNMSGWDPKTKRPGWERMLDDLRAGRLRAVVAWHVDRFTRQPRQLEELIDAASAGGAEIHTVNGGRVESLVMIRIMSALAAEESDHKSRRIRRRHLTLATEERKPHGGRRRFGYEKGMDELRDEEADVVRDVAGRFLRGESLNSLARELAARVATPEGGKWTGSNLGTLLRRPHLAGLRVYQKDVIGKGTWPSIIDETTHYAIVEKMSDPDRKTSTTNARVYLLAGLATCDTCGAKLRGRPLHKGDGRAYACATGRHCHRSVELVDACVETLIVDRLSMMDASGALIDDKAAADVRALEAERVGLSAKLDALTIRNLEGTLSDAQLERSSAAIEARQLVVVASLRTARAAVAAPSIALEGMTGEDAASAWADAPLGRRRKIIEFLCERVALVGAKSTRAPFDPADVVVEWRRATMDR